MLTCPICESQYKAVITTDGKLRLKDYVFEESDLDEASVQADNNRDLSEVTSMTCKSYFKKIERLGGGKIRGSTVDENTDEPIA